MSKSVIVLDDVIVSRVIEILVRTELVRTMLRQRGKQKRTISLNNVRSVYAKTYI